MSESYEKLERRLTRGSRKALRELNEAKDRQGERSEALHGAQLRMYANARPSRLTSGWTHATSSADSELRSSLTNLRNRSRALSRDSAYGTRARVIVINNVIGSGIGLQAQVKNTRGKLSKKVNENIEETWEDWMRAERCHTGGELHFSDLERVAMSEVFEAGEVFIREHRTSFGDSEVPYALELIEGERIPHTVTPELQRGGAGGRMRMGIERDKFGRPLGYWIRDRHPGDIHDGVTGVPGTTMEFVPADEIIHLRVIQRWPQSRGVPWLHAVATKINDMSGYSEAEIVAARGAANYLASVEKSDLTSPEYEEQSDGTYEMELEPGMILRPRAGEKITFFAPNRPNSALDPFMRYMLREVAAGVGVSYESLSRDYSQSNYSSSRLSLLDDRDLWRVLQMWFIRSVRHRIHRNWLSMAVLSEVIQGISVQDYALNLQKFERAKYKPRGWSWIDPTKEVAAFKEAVKAGFITTGRVIAQTAAGADFEDITEERAQELEMQQELGLSFDTDPGQTPTEEPAAPPPDDDDEDNEDDEDEDGDETKTAQVRLIK